MRTTLLVAAVIAALVIPLVAYREPPVPLVTSEQQEEIDPVLDMVSNECTPTLQHLEDGLTLIRLCANAR